MDRLIPYYTKLPIWLRIRLKRMFRWLSKRGADRGEVHASRDLSLPSIYACWPIPFTLPLTASQMKQAGVQLNEVFVCGIKNAYVQIGTGVVRLEDGKLLADSTPTTQSQRAAEWFDGFGAQSALRLSGRTYAVITSVDDSNYFHWLIDTLPRLLVLDSLPLEATITLLMRADLKPFQRLSLEMCLPPTLTVQYVEERDWVSVETLLFPSYVRLQLNKYIPIEYLNFVRDAIRAQIAAADAPAAERIYISRQAASARRVGNEAEVVDCLSRYGFEVVQMELLPFAEQVKLMRSVKWIVGPHGAGMTNMLFADQATVIEFTYNSPRPVLYRNLAFFLGHRYADLTVEKRKLGTEMYVDVEQLERKLIELGA